MTIIAASAASPPPRRQAGCRSTAAVLTVLQLAVQWIKDDAATKAVESARQAIASAEALAEEIRRTTHSAIADTITPLLRLLAQMEETDDPTERASAREAVLTSVVVGAPAVLGPERTRACYFALKFGGVDNHTPVALTFAQAGGRADAPRTLFDAGTDVGDAATTTLLDDTIVFCADTEVDPPPSWTDHPHEYRTFLAVPVRGRDQVFGMLTVDALNPGDLSRERDEPILTVLARILAVSQISRPDEAGQ